MLNVVSTSPLFDLPHARMASYDDGNLETDSDYYYAKIHKQVRNDIKEMKEAGKISLTKSNIDSIINSAIKKFSDEE
jgi:hypothetical protein